VVANLGTYKHTAAREIQSASWRLLLHRETSLTPASRSVLIEILAPPRYQRGFALVLLRAEKHAAVVKHKVAIANGDRPEVPLVEFQDMVAIGRYPAGRFICDGIHASDKVDTIPIGAVYRVFPKHIHPFFQPN